MPNNAPFVIESLSVPQLIDYASTRFSKFNLRKWKPDRWEVQAGGLCINGSTPEEALKRFCRLLYSCREPL